MRILLLIGLTFGGMAAACVGAVDGRVSQPTVRDVRESLRDIQDGGRPLGAWAGEQMVFPFYSLNAEHDFGDNHFQGVQRLRAGPYLVVSGSNIGREGDLTRLGFPRPANWDALPLPQGDLFVLRFGERPSAGPLGPNVSAQGVPSLDARVVARVSIRLPLRSGTTLWHPGGISACGNVLVVPVENYNARHGEICSQILFFDFSDPERPRRLPVLIDRTEEPVKDKAGAAAMIPLSDGRLLVASRTSTHTSFYVSRSTVIEEGFEAKPVSVLDEKLVFAEPGLTFTKFSGSSINFIRQTDGQLFLVGYGRSKADLTAGQPERHTASLWRVEFPEQDLRRTPRLTRVLDRAFTDPRLGDAGWGVFGAAAGIFVTDAGRLAIYSTPRGLVRRVGEFSLEDLKAGRSVGPKDRLFVPAIELWPRP